VPPQVSEITEGVAFSRSSEEGVIADSQQRIFRVLLSQPAESFDIQATCGVKIGDELRAGAGIYCTSFDARFEGSSRMSMLCTFNFGSTAGSSGGGGGGSDPQSQAPDVRPANWSISSSLYEIPVRVWRKRTSANTWSGPGAAANPANDMYDGVTAFDAAVTISIIQYESTDPTRHARHVGAINRESITLGSLTMPPHTVMFRGLSCEPIVESWGSLVYRGWKCAYEFAYKANDTSIHLDANGVGGLQLVELGWDIAVPQTGFNVIAFQPPGEERDELDAQPLKHANGKIVPIRELPTEINNGDKVRGMVKVFDYESGGASQLPCAQPIPLNDSGRPRKITLPPLVYGYQVHRDINFTTTFNLRTT
jgi:hypothetical protein